MLFCDEIVHGEKLEVTKQELTNRDKCRFNYYFTDKLFCALSFETRFCIESNRNTFLNLEIKKGGIHTLIYLVIF